MAEHDRPGVGARDGRRTKEKTSEPADAGFFKEALRLFGFGGQFAGVKAITPGLDRVTKRVTDARKKRKQQ